GGGGTGLESMGASRARGGASRVATSRRTAGQRSMEDLDGKGEGVVAHRAPNSGMCGWRERLQGADWTPLSSPPPQAPDEIPQDEELFEHRHALPLTPELGEQLPQPASPRHVEAERLGEILQWLCRRVCGDVDQQGRGHSAA